jgi:hypothetical protein
MLSVAFGLWRLGRIGGDREASHLDASWFDAAPERCLRLLLPVCLETSSPLLVDGMGGMR